MIKKAVETALRGLVASKRELSVLLTGDEEIRELNSRFRKKDVPTDVLSFPIDDEVLLGDVVVSVDTARRQAHSYGVGLAEEAARLLIHGALHLVGYEHVNGGRQAAKMKRKEEETLRELRGEGLL